MIHQSARLDSILKGLTELVDVPRICLVVDSWVLGCIGNVDAVDGAGSNGTAFAEEGVGLVAAGGAAELVPRIRSYGIGIRCKQQVTDAFGVGAGTAAVEPVVA